MKIKDYMLFTKNIRLMLPKKMKAVYSARRTKYINASAGKTKIMLRKVVQGL
jgi:hypothetical protein